eukprot:jgi/Chlat1/7376/Chrsp6S07414
MKRRWTPRSQTWAQPQALPLTSTGQSVGVDAAQASSSTDQNDEAKEAEALWEQRSKRPEFGKLGRSIKVFANFYRAELIANSTVYQYDVSVAAAGPVERSVSNRALLRAIVQVLQDSSDYRKVADDTMLAFDGYRNVYTAQAIPSPLMLRVDIPATSEQVSALRYTVTLKLVAAINMYALDEYLRGQRPDVPQPALQGLYLAMRMTAAQKYWSFGRSLFFHQSFGFGSLGNGLCYSRGYFQSLRPVQAGLAFNLDMSATAVYKEQGVVEAVAEFLDYRIASLRKGIQGSDALHVQDFLCNVQVGTTHQGLIKRRFRIAGLSPNSADNQTFVLNVNGVQRTCTVAEYFSKTYNLDLKYPKLPCANAARGLNANPQYYPLEVLKVVAGQRHIGRLSARQVAEMLKVQKQRPDQRKQDIDRTVRECRFETDRYTRQFGVYVNPNMLEVNARVLRPPQLQYSHSQVSQKPGSWSMFGKGVIQPGKPVRNWVAIVVDRTTQATLVENFGEQLAAAASQLEMEVAAKAVLVLPVGNLTFEAALRRALDAAEKGNSRADLVVAVLPTGKDATLYGDVKRVCETMLDIPSQCISSKWVTRPSPYFSLYLTNVLLKVNVKIGGVNVALHAAVRKTLAKVSDRDMPTIVFGGDVSHPPPLGGGPSIASVVASMDWPLVTSYRSVTRAQRRRKEGFAELCTTTVSNGIPRREGIIVELLKAFQAKENLKPERLIFYRDGVSEGQFKEVLYHELTQIQQACQAALGNVSPITFIVVQKRNHTRLFAKDHQDTTKSGNVLPGTCVDTHICSPWEHDFYLVAHEGLQGTSRVTHYYVLHDDNNFTADGIQQLTYDLCYTYARATRSVSIVPPAYYAHLAAFRARAYGTYTSRAFVNTSASSAGAEAFPPLPEVGVNIRETMYYC